MNLFLTRPRGLRRRRRKRWSPWNRSFRLIMRISFVYAVLLIGSMKLLALTPASGQDLQNIKVTLELSNETFKDVFKKIEDQTDLLFSYNPEVSSYHAATLPKGLYTVKEVLDQMFEETPLKYRLEGKHIIISLAQEQEKEITESIASEAVVDQPALISGRVVDETTQQPIPGVNIIVKQTTRGTASDAQGNFAIDAVEGETLIFSFIGFKTKEIVLTNQTELNVSLEVEATTLQEVTVNAGYYDVKDREKTGSISKVSANVITNQPVTNPLQALQGRVPGIYISQYTGLPGGNFQVRIRGTNSLSNGNNPLYVIDGVPFISESLSDPNTSSNLYGIGLGVSPLNSINPNDIESIEILKDADATAIYGSRGANGVILIVTKKGKAGGVKVDVNIKSGFSKVMRQVDLLSTQQYVDMRTEAVHNDGEAAPASDDYDINGTWDQNRYTNWQDVLIGGTAKMTDINTSISGGSTETQFLFGAGYNNQGTVFPGDNTAGRFSTHFSVTHTSTNKKFNTRLSNSYIVNKSNILNSDMTLVAVSLPPNAPKLYDTDGKLNWENSTWYNPLAWLENRFNSRTYNLLTNVELAYEIVKGLRIKTNVGLNDFRNEERRTQSSSSLNPVYHYTSALSELTTGTATNRSWIIEPQVNWEGWIGKGKLSVLVGGTYQDRVNEETREIFKGFPSNALINSPKSAASAVLDSYNFAEYRYAAAYGRLNYVWEEKYILNITGRRDGSSRFGPNKKFANLGAVGLAWIFSNEGVFKNNLSFLSFGKIRGSYGITGNDQIGDYRYLDAYVSSSQYQGISSLLPNQLYNPNYGWEKNKKIEGAVELGFLNDRILLTTAYYRNRSSNQLIDYKLAATTGYSSVLLNFPATVQNTGLELELTTLNVSKGSLKWTTAMNITFSRNMLVSFPNLESSSYANMYVIGRPLNILKLYHYLGVDPVTGLYQVEDVNHDGAFTPDDQNSLVENVQKYYGGVSNSFSFKGLQVDIFFQFVKQSGLLFTSNIGGQPGYKNMNQPSTILEGRWQNPGDHATKQVFSRSVAAKDAQDRFNSSDARVGDRSFIRLKNVAISYQLPDRYLHGVKSRIYIQGQNLLTFTNYSGLDPEGGSELLPPLTTFLAGLQLTF